MNRELWLKLLSAFQSTNKSKHFCFGTNYTRRLESARHKDKWIAKNNWRINEQIWAKVEVLVFADSVDNKDRYDSAGEPSSYALVSMAGSRSTWLRVVFEDSPKTQRTLKHKRGSPFYGHFTLDFHFSFHLSLSLPNHNSCGPYSLL